MKKQFFILVFVATASSLSAPLLSNSNNQYPPFGQNNYTKNQRPARAVHMKRCGAHMSTRSLTSLQVQYIANSLIINFNYRNKYTVQIINEGGLVLHNQNYSNNLHNQTQINLSGFDKGTFDLKIILSEGDYYIGSFTIE